MGSVAAAIIGLQFLSITLLAAPDAAPLQPLTACELLKSLTDYHGKVVAVLGRFSFRSGGRSLSQEACTAVPSEAKPRPAVFAIATDEKSGPQAPARLEIDGAAVSRELKGIRQHTSLRQFRFGSPDYDRWAIVYARVESGHQPETTPASNTAAEPDRSPPELVIRGESAIILLRDDE